MQPLRHMRFILALLAAGTLGCAALGNGIATASGRGDRSSHFMPAPAPRVTSQDQGTIPCPNSNCGVVVHSNASASTFRVQTAVPVGAPPSSDDGTLNWAQKPDAETNHPLSCGGYQPRDTNSFQFFLGQASLGSILYQITYTVMRAKPAQAQFCLGRVNVTFKTMSGKDAKPDTLPNGLQGFVGLLPVCDASDVGRPVPCVVSKTSSGSDTVLKVQVPALDGDPWGRA